MSILFVLVMFLLCISFSHHAYRKQQHAVTAQQPVRMPEMIRAGAFELPKGYCFHPGHTWVLDEGGQNARVGLDAFAATLLGKVDRIEVTRHDRWVRQGQKIWSVTRDGITVDMVAPVEGIVTSVNPVVLNNPNRVAEDPYGDGWVLTLQTPQMSTCLKNLVPTSLITGWMQHNVERLGTLCTAAAGTALDGGYPVPGVLAIADPELRARITKEFFLI